MNFRDMPPTDRKTQLRAKLIEAAERAVAQEGIAGIRARTLAAEAGCAVGAIYTVFADLDELVLAVNARTLAALETTLGAASKPRDLDPGELERGGQELVRLAGAYLDFAVANLQRWRALFEFRLAEGKDVPDWFLADRLRLFGYIEEPLRHVLPGMAAKERGLLARSLFSAVHGIVTLGLEEKLGVVSVEDLRRQTMIVVEALTRGLASLAIAGPDSVG